MPESERRLVAYPYVVVRVACELCDRGPGRYRLARLAAKFGADFPLDDLLLKLTGDCPLQRPRHPYMKRCAARFIDLDPPRRPPDAPATVMKLVAGGRR